MLTLIIVISHGRKLSNANYRILSLFIYDYEFYKYTITHEYVHPRIFFSIKFLLNSVANKLYKYENNFSFFDVHIFG